MKKLIGYSLFCIGIGMLAGCFIESAFLLVVLIFACMIAGYWLFCCC